MWSSSWSSGSSHSILWSSVHVIYRVWRKVFDEYTPPRMAVAETWHPTSERTYLYARPDELGQVFDFSLLKSEWGRNQFRAVIQRSIADHTAAGAGGGLTWVLSSHDVCRHSSRFALPPGSPGQLAAEQRNGPTG